MWCVTADLTDKKHKTREVMEIVQDHTVTVGF